MRTQALRYTSGYDALKWKRKKMRRNLSCFITCADWTTANTHSFEYLYIYFAVFHPHVVYTPLDELLRVLEATHIQFVHNSP